MITLIDASLLPVAINCPSGLNAPALQAPLWDVTYTVSYSDGSGAVQLTLVSNSKSNQIKYRI